MMHITKKDAKQITEFQNFRKQVAREAKECGLMPELLDALLTSERE